MPNDIVERLRSTQNPGLAVRQQAADEIESLRSRLAEAEALLRDIYSYAEDQGMETLMDMIDAAMEQSHE